MLLRTEIGIDAAGIDQLLITVSGPEAARQLQKLRERAGLALGIVACDDAGQIHGYVAFSSVLLNGEECGWVSLETLAVAPSHSESRLARQLVFEGLDSLNEFGYSAVAVEGSDRWYQELGFHPTSQLSCQNSEKLWVYGLALSDAAQTAGRLTRPEIN